MPVPYAHLTNPQTLNLYALVSDDPETFADLNGHDPNSPEAQSSATTSAPQACGVGQSCTAPGTSGNACSGASCGTPQAVQQQKNQTAQPQVDNNGNPTFKPTPPAPPPTADQKTEYPTLNAAGKAAEKRTNPGSITEGREYAGWVTKNPDGTYSVGAANPGTRAGSDPGPRPRNAAASYHTHGANDPGYDNEHFSPQDRDFARQNHVPGYLGTPGHTIQKYNPASDQVTVFNERTN